MRGVNNEDGCRDGYLLGLLMSLLLWIAAEPARTVDECQADIAALKVQTQNASSSSSPPSGAAHHLFPR